ncbi:DUF6508 domain-containing protein [Streptomyces sp. HP-A2021]|uniref:DUF6508 domain-containing protein n=1 Tax=Streptomyces sp. HP-A2021 TaxID=2927875 RepID=UPI001FAF8395|nr:DUF6508 domain-containing protein [Streptomyces sp. HP-A2021]UOB12939.1 DUF6508 domain-containing protein [Streptomyces sp. HP-A2021]
MTNPVHYITVTAPDGEVIGYAWAAVDADDVEWINRRASSSSAYDAGTEWYGRIREARERGLTPLGVLNLLSHEPGVGPVTEAAGADAVEELARVVTPADDQRLLAQLDRDDAEAWRELAEAFDALTDEDRDVEWGGGQKSPSGAIHVPFPMYSEGVYRAVHALQGVGAVTSEHRWMDNPMPTLPPEGGLRPADAVRAATAVVRGEKFCDGTIDEALKSGLLDAVVASLRAWYADPAAAQPAPPAVARPEGPEPRRLPEQDLPEPPDPSLPMCRFCGGSPAADVAFRAHRGLVVLMGFRKTDGPMCMTCGLAVYRALTTHTLAWGWWSPLSLFVFAPLTLVRNVLAVRRVKQLPAPGPGMLGPRYDPGVPVRRRPRAYIALIPALWVLFMIVTGLSGGV